VLKGFINLDTSLYYWLLRIPRTVQDRLPWRYQADLADYRAAMASSKIIMHDCRKPLPFEDGTVDHILASHFLEHVYPNECKAILRDYHRALKPGGTLHVIVPDLKAYVDEYIRLTKKNPTKAADWFVEHSLLSRPTRGSLRYRLMEMTGLFGLQHRWMYDQPSLEKIVRESGFTLFDGKGTPSRAYVGTDPRRAVVFARKK
jgi:predicted SAM-dependent methyltransferase